MATQHRHALCGKRRGFQAALEVRKVYRVMLDLAAEAKDLVRDVDESGEEYLYPAPFSSRIELPRDRVKMFSKR